MRLPRLLSKNVLSAFALAGFAASTAGCRKDTEIVLDLTVVGPLPAHFTVDVARQIPFGDVPSNTPSYVVPSLGQNGDLELDVTLATKNVLISLLPTQMNPEVVGDRALTISFAAPDYSVVPATPQAVSFTDGESKELQFTLTTLPPDMGMPQAVDAAMPAPVVDMAVAAPQG